MTLVILYPSLNSLSYDISLYGVLLIVPLFRSVDASAGSRRRAVLVQPLGKVGLVNLGNSCFMNSALRALFCSYEFKHAIMSDTLRYVRSEAGQGRK